MNIKLKGMVIAICLSFFGFFSAFAFEPFEEEEKVRVGSIVPEEKKGRDIWVLSIPGGGVRGIIPASILSKLEEETGASSSELFDVFAGTSTGSLVACGLNVPVAKNDGRPCSAAQMVGLYKKKASIIFERKFLSSLSVMWGLTGPIYKSGNLESVLVEQFGDAHLKDSIRPMFITTYNMTHRRPLLFKSTKAAHKEGRDILLSCALLSACSAPGYFPPVKLDWEGEQVSLADGCVHANDPSWIAYKKAKKMYPDGNIHLVSIGTGRKNHLHNHEEAKGRGGISTLHWVTEEMIHTQSEDDHKRLEKKLNKPNHPKRYFRFQVNLDPNKGALDDPSKENLCCLEQQALALLELEQKNNFLELVARLKKKLEK